MNPNFVIPQSLLKRHEQIKKTLAEAIRFCDGAGDKQGRAVLSERLSTLGAPAMLVVVGEVKMGKSSFINSLLNATICPTGVEIVTATIQEICFGEEDRVISLGKQWDRRELNHSLLNAVTVVDTPGTNSPELNHETITKSYIPRCDVVIFVFSCGAGPFGKSQWDFLGSILEWGRKVVFVLQKCDMVPLEVVERHKQYVAETARNKYGIQNPIVFSLSALREQEKAPYSGFSELRGYLQEAIEKGEVARSKLEGVRILTREIISRQVDALSKQEGLLAEEAAFLERLLSTLDVRRSQTQQLEALLVESVVQAYESLGRSLREEFANGLEVGKLFARAFRGGTKKWLESLQEDFRQQVVSQLATDAKRVALQIERETKAVLEQIKKEIPRDGSSTLLELSERLSKFSFDRLFVGEDALQGLTNALRLSSVLGAVGVALLLASSLVIIDITGGILASAGAAGSAGLLVFKRKSIIRDFEHRMSDSSRELRERCAREIAGVVNVFFLELRSQIEAPFSRTQEQVERLRALINQGADLLTSLET